MFNFDVHDDVRLTHDAAVEKDEASLQESPVSCFCCGTTVLTRLSRISLTRAR